MEPKLRYRVWIQTRRTVFTQQASQAVGFWERTQLGWWSSHNHGKYAARSPGSWSSQSASQEVGQWKWKQFY
jgi:hypothetical protein